MSDLAKERIFYTFNLLLIYLFRKWNPCLCRQALSSSIRHVQAIAAAFSNVVASFAHIFHLL